MIIFTLFLVEVRSIAVSMSVYVFVCSHISKTTCRNFTNFLYMLRVVVAQSSSDNSLIHYGLPVLWMTLFLK